MRVLVADDDVSIRGMLCSMLTEWGYEVVAATNGSRNASLYEVSCYS